MLSEDERKLLELFRRRGYLPDRPFLNHECAVSLMRKGLVEVMKPTYENGLATPGRAVPIPTAEITPAGREALSND